MQEKGSCFSKSSESRRCLCSCFGWKPLCVQMSHVQPSFCYLLGPSPGAETSNPAAFLCCPTLLPRPIPRFLPSALKHKPQLKLCVCGGWGGSTESHVPTQPPQRVQRHYFAPDPQQIGGSFFCDHRPRLWNSLRNPPVMSEPRMPGASELPKPPTKCHPTALGRFHLQQHWWPIHS